MQLTYPKAVLARMKEAQCGNCFSEQRRCSEDKANLDNYERTGWWMTGVWMLLAWPLLALAVAMNCGFLRTEALLERRRGKNEHCWSVITAHRQHITGRQTRIALILAWPQPALAFS